MLGGCKLPAIQYGFLAGILEKGGGTRVVCAAEPWAVMAHVQPGERVFLVPHWRIRFPVPYGLWPLTVGAAEIFTAVSLWPEKLARWGTWEAEKYFREQVLPLMPSGNRPAWWWQEPQRFVL